MDYCCTSTERTSPPRKEDTSGYKKDWTYLRINVYVLALAARLIDVEIYYTISFKHQESAPIIP